VIYHASYPRIFAHQGTHTGDEIDAAIRIAGLLIFVDEIARGLLVWRHGNSLTRFMVLLRPHLGEVVGGGHEAPRALILDGLCAHPIAPRLRRPPARATDHA
jgi:hypothetical protein